MVGECARQDLYEFIEQTEAALARLDALLTQLFVDCLHQGRNLRLQHGHRPTTHGEYTATTHSGTVIIVTVAHL